mgnify:CR=1 FL=1
MSDILYSTDLGKYYLGKCEETIQEGRCKVKYRINICNTRSQFNLLEYIKKHTKLVYCTFKQ